MVILCLIMIYSILKETSIANYFGMTIIAIFGVALTATIILTILLGLQWIPNYFNSLYILFGSMIVAVIGVYLNQKLVEEKEQRKTNRIIQALNLIIKENKKNAKNILVDIQKPQITNLKELKIGFWDTFNSSIINVDLDPKIVKDLLLIKDLTLDINQEIIERNELVEKQSLSEIECIHPPKLVNMDKTLIEKLNKIIYASDGIFGKITT